MADDRVTADGRLIILEELARQVDGRANELVLARILDAYGVRRSSAWLRTQLSALAELEAVRLHDVADIKVAELRRAGRNHVDRRALLDGVSVPRERD